MAQPGTKPLPKIFMLMELRDPRNRPEKRDSPQRREHAEIFYFTSPR